MAKNEITDLNSFYESIYESMEKFEGAFMWWRGQAKLEWNLIPKLYHLGLKSNESEYIHLFINKAKIRHEKFPDRKDKASWLFLMQHYGLPTRILDWSESPLVALYFAVQETGEDQKPGVLWGLFAPNLNYNQTGSKVIYTPTSPITDTLITKPFKFDKNEKETTIATISDHFDVRQMIQSSVVTIHGLSTPLNDMASSDKFLVKFEIPYTKKRKFRGILTDLGITKSYLFPDLDTLSQDIQNLKFKKGHI